MTLSRTARILIAVLLLAAAAFFWVNFFSQEQPAATPVTAIATPPATPSSSGAPASTSGSKAQPATTAANHNAAPVVASDRPAVATRDLQVAELPFLVTQPPPAAGQTGAANGAGGSAGASTTSSTQTSASAQRMSVNPFSPIAVKAPPAATQASVQPPAPQPVTTAAAPSNQPAAPPKLAEAPAPQPVTPPPPQASGLPHVLPSGMLPTTPGVLQSTRAQASSSAPKDLGAVAAVRVPAPSDGTSLGTITPVGALAAGPSVPGLLGPNQANATTSGQQANAGNAPLQAGTDALSRYLRDNNVRFTGTVLGPVSVGVFRSSQYKMPVVVPLGQDLPDTRITLTDLRGHEAVFTLNDSTQSLSLDLRR